MTVPTFAEFYEGVHGYPPFPWQVLLAERVVAEGWPRLLDLPTASGKTSALDIALYVMAVAPERSPRRIFLVVDRRIVVDHGAAHAEKILDRLRAGAAPEISRGLLALFEPAAGEQVGDPFVVATLRGGMPRERDWARRPDQPVLGTSTVDQVGSRLLFRGYGLPSTMAPVHAGLLGTSTLFLLDEVHLSQPFAQTLDAISDRWARDHGPTVVRMSATPCTVSPDAFHLSEADRADAVLSRRLGASKHARLQEVRVSGDEDGRRKALALACAKAARALLDGGREVVAVVMNRVDHARRVWAELASDSAIDVVLLTGRMRPIDRDAVLDGSSGVIQRAGAARERGSAEAKPLVVVATQCIEAGADLDFDGLVTECASLDALRQRFGRVDRRGDLGQTESVIVLRSDQVEPKRDDPVYGRSLPTTWRWLNEVATDSEVGFGVDELDELLRGAEDVREAVVPEARAAPVLLPAHLDSWAQTSPVPYPDPDVALWLHGPEPGDPDVHVIWRADVTEEMLLAAEADQHALDDLSSVIASCRPNSLEALPVPIYAVHAWLLAQPEAEVNDATNRADIQTGRDDARGAAVVRWLGDRAEVIRAGDPRPGGLRPGDTLIVPSVRGGIEAYNWGSSDLSVGGVGQVP